ncbi:cyclohexanone monooxygenase [Williamsia sp. 1138]|uniref:flavin-containing monooxygenase n=1 Tax=Williamsia sp. 1138 TaxID=1903117 RepID=UPI000A0F40BF|nr:NAD(P)/FAD-dependent oxidoreductase [Williamsia sp. 1138]OZG27707.1 cyclohexanone monooxygenase [Williamsia sp. 1138]
MSDQESTATPLHTDAVVIGAGFGGIRMLIELQKLGLSAVALEAGTDVGGTWYWNRYPGARTDSESWSYCFPFPEIEQEWNWAERYPGQVEVQKYIAFVADRFDVRRNIRFSHRVLAATYDKPSNLWTITAENGQQFTCTYFLPALGHLSVPQEPQFEGINSFTGDIYRTSQWPKDHVDLTGKRVAVIGTGASGIQTIPHVAEAAKHLTVFQRTPNYVMPAQNHDLDDEFRRKIKEDYAAVWDKARGHVFGFPMDPAGRMYDDVDIEAERERIFEEGWQNGGFHFVFETFDDLILDQRSNDAAADFIRKKIAETVKDPAIAELLTPRGYPYVSKRPPSGTNYYETFNRDNVTLVDIQSNPIEAITANGLRTSDRDYEFDVIILATGFDAVTGALNNIDIRGEDGVKLSQYWAGGPETFLGIGTPGFPNMLMICGPQSAYANIPVIIEGVVNWLSRALNFMKDNGYDRMQPTEEATEQWTTHVSDVFNMTLLPSGESANSWYLGANTPGKPRRVLFYFGGAAGYFQELEKSAGNDFAGFEFSKVPVKAHN